MQARPLVLAKGPVPAPRQAGALVLCRSEPPPHAQRSGAANSQDQVAPATGAAAAAPAHHYHVSRVIATLAADTTVPATWQRMLPALPMLLPICEGMWRLACMLAGHLQRLAVDIMAVSQLQGATITTNLKAVQAVDPARAMSMLQDLKGQQHALAWAQQLYQDTCIVLSQLGIPSHPLRGSSAGVGTVHATATAAPLVGTTDAAGAAIGSDDVATFIVNWVTRNWGTSEALWAFGWSVGLLLLAGIAAQQAQSSKRHHKQQGNSCQPDAHSRLQLPQPQLVLAACWAALLLRLAWTPLHPLSLSAGMSAAFDLLAPAVVGLTLATTYAAIMYFCKVLLAAFQPDTSTHPQPQRHASQQDMSWLCAEMVSGSVMLAGWHRTVAVCDVLYVVLLASLPSTHKFQAAAAFILYSLGLDWVTAQAQACTSGWAAAGVSHGSSNSSTGGGSGIGVGRHSPRNGSSQSSWMDG